MATNFPIADVVNVIVSSADRPIQTTDFTNVLLIAMHNTTPLNTEADDNNLVEFDGLSSVAAMGFVSGHPVYDMCSLMYGGSFPPKKIILKRATVSAYYLDIYSETNATYVLSLKYRATNGTWTTISVSSATGGSPSASAVATALASAINSHPSLYGAAVASSSGSQLIITPSSAGSVYRGGTYPVVVYPSTANIGWALGQGATSTSATHYAEAKQLRNDFFFVISGLKDSTQIFNLASSVETDNKMLVSSNVSTSVWSSSTSDVASLLKGASLSKTVYVANKNAVSPLTTYYPDASLVGEWAATIPGKNITFGKTLKGINQNSFTPTELSYAKSKNANVYINRGGLGWFEEGKVASGSYADVVRGSIWLEVTMEEDIFAFIKRKSDLNQKIPYTDAGVQMIASVMAKRLDIAVQNDFISKYKIFPPLVEDISTQDKTNRILPDIPFEATLSGAFQNVVIRGVCSV